MKLTRSKAYVCAVFGASLVMMLMMVTSVLQSSNLKLWSHDGRSSEKVDQKKFFKLRLPEELTEHRSSPRDDHGSLKAVGEFMQKIVYNRVGKCGSRSMLSLISQLSKRNNFTYYQSPISNQTSVPVFDLIDIVKTIDELPFPSLYSRHLHYIEFAKFGVRYPVYINMIRDPIERFSSQYHFLRYGDYRKTGSRLSHPWKDGEREMDINDCVLANHPSCVVERLFYIVPYFCGQDLICRRPGKDSLHRAKFHVMENYLVVGYLEDFDGMLKVLEKLLPNYFSGSSKMWATFSAAALNHTSTVKKTSINATTKAVLRLKMKEEYEFYEFVKHRFDHLKRRIAVADAAP